MQRSLVVLAILFALSACTNAQDISQLVEVGQTKNEIKNILGSPYKTDALIKSVEHMWGLEESFWFNIPSGTKLDVWRHKNEAG